MPLIKRHVFTANKQWDAHKRIRQNLPTDALLTVEDYQINNALEPWEQPIAVSYAANQKQFALYPVGVEYMKENALKKTAIIFLTEDLAHDHQQVRKFEARVFEIMRQQLNRDIKHWVRFSDGCGAQFKSRFATPDLPKFLIEQKLKSAAYHYYESHEGKNISDTIGSMAKSALRRATIKTMSLPRDPEEVVNLIRQEIGLSSEKFEHIIVECFKPFEREDAKSRREIPIDGIRKICSLTTRVNNTTPTAPDIKAKPLTCTSCEANKECDLCKLIPLVDQKGVDFDDIQ